MNYLHSKVDYVYGYISDTYVYVRMYMYIPSFVVYEGNLQVQQVYDRSDMPNTGEHC